MSYLLSPISTREDFTALTSHGISKKKHHRNILKHKEICYKRKCIRALKNKLKKYKLRHDGSEDQDVLDVSQILIKSLNIKSPDSQSNNKNNNCILDENYPRNYLFKMGRKKQLVKCNEKSDLDRSFVNHNHDDLGSISCTENKDKQQTNAFKLLMDSRNKSIGSNSPGKEKVIDENEAQEIAEKKNLKAKRSLALQKMAESKGSLQKKEIEEYQEICIKKKMEKRAERLKNMITNNTKTTKIEKQTNKDCDVKSSPKIKSDLEANVKTDTEELKQKSLTLISLFNNTEIKNNISPRENVSKEDSEFLKKLSPSLKKKENMLCYFKKVDKEIPSPPDIENENCNIDNAIIKVKLSSKLKKKSKKKKLSMSKVTSENSKSEDVLSDNVEIISNDAVENLQSESITSKDGRKRKRDGFVDDNILNDSNNKEKPATECRPKRNIKKPVKYSEDAEVFSSDDELHIFTPKKKKPGDNKPTKLITRTETTNGCKLSQEINNKSDVTLKTKSTKKVDKKADKVHDTHKLIAQKKNVKLAPIFAAKSQLDPAAIEAKQKFLQSGVPEKLKKIISDQKNRTVQEFTFPITVHIQQIANNKCFDLREIAHQHLSEDISDSVLNFSVEDNLFQSMFDALLDNTDTLVDSSLTVKSDKCTVLQSIKKSYPKFSVFRTYRLLKDKKCGVIKDCSYQDIDNSIEVIDDFSNIVNESPDKLSWADKYKATSSKHIIGNFESIRELRKWLVTWTENEVKSKNKVNFVSDSSDFCHSDSDSKDSTKTTNNLLLITGPVGSGKTSSVYAVAAELAIKVIEVNASSKRTGKIMLQDLQEATQSHKVNRGKSSTENSQKSQEVHENKKKPLNKRGRPKKNLERSASKSSVTVTKNESLGQSQPINSQESVRTGMSLILIDDADIVFEQDDGFSSAIVQLVQCSKRPVILISSTASCSHLQRFSQIAKNIIMRPFQPRMLGTWLDIMCLADSGICVPGTGATVLDFNRGDIRKAINSLHFYVSSQIQTENESNTPNSDISPVMEDENSSMSWIENYNTEDKGFPSNSSDNQLCKRIIGQKLTLSQCNPLDLFNVWWSMPRLLTSPINFEHVKDHIENNNAGKRLHTVVEIEALANALESISIADFFRPTKSLSNDITCDPWLSVETDTVSENEVLEDYKRDEELIEEISNRLICGSVFEAQNTLKIDRNRDVQFPSMDLQRERDRVVSRHHNLSDSFNPSAALDRKALSMDYWSYCRTICRVEKSKTDNNSKRNNRFCHYLKSLNVMCKLDYFDKLADSLQQPSEPNEEQKL